MHRVLFIREILLDIFGYCSPTERYDRGYHKADLVALARTCQTFKEPALDILWEKLLDLSPLYLCLREACKINRSCYSFSRPLSEAEWNTLRGYTRRVRSICKSVSIGDKRFILPLVPSTNPLFPNLRSLSWGSFEPLPAEHVIVPSLNLLFLNFFALPVESLDAIGERCPYIRQFEISFFHAGPRDAIVSRQLCRWPNLQYANCRGVTLSMDAIFHLPSFSTLRRLSFTLNADLGNHLTHLGSPIIFSDLTGLEIHSISLKSITTFFSRIQLPRIKDLRVTVSEYTPRWAVQEYWTTIQKACLSNTVARLVFSSVSDDETNDFPDLDGQEHLCLTLHDLLPYKDFGNLHIIGIDVAWSVNLTDSDVLDLVSTSPQLEELLINDRRGWKMDGEGGITLSGLLQLLRRCPSLYRMSLVIDTRTFTRIPHGLDISFPSRQTPQGVLSLYCLDSKRNPDCEPVFEALKLHVCYGMNPRSRI